MDVKRYILTLMAILFILSKVEAQKTNNISLTARTVTTFDMSAITVAGEKRATITDNSQWLNYGIRDNSGILYTIQAVAVAGSIPPGVEVRVELGPFIGTGQGGQSTGPQLISYSPVILVNNMGQGITGVGQNCGHNVILYIKVSNFALLHPSSSPLTIQYSIVSQ